MLSYKIMTKKKKEPSYIKKAHTVLPNCQHRFNVSSLNAPWDHVFLENTLLHLVALLQGNRALLLQKPFPRDAPYPASNIRSVCTHAHSSAASGFLPSFSADLSLPPSSTAFSPESFKYDIPVFLQNRGFGKALGCLEVSRR